MKKLNLVFTTDANTTFNVGLTGPKEDLTLAECRTAAEKLLPILTTKNGTAITGFKKAVLVNTTEEELA